MLIRWPLTVFTLCEIIKYSLLRPVSTTGFLYLNQMLLKNITNCSTYPTRGLDYQLILQINKISPNLLVKIDNLNIILGEAVHPWLQSPAKECLAQALSIRGAKMQINSAFRTIAGQALLRNHYLNRRCNIKATAPPGGSNHNGASAIDIENALSWKDALHASCWKWLGQSDPMHFDCVHPDIKDIRPISVKAFQQLWNKAYPHDVIVEDGIYGDKTAQRLLSSPAEGFRGAGIPRILKLDNPYQIGNDVKELQLTLVSWGFFVVVDQVFGPKTHEAVREFQSAKGLSIDGIVDEKIRMILDL